MSDELVYCSFCGRSDGNWEVKVMVKAEGVAICDKCIDLCCVVALKFKESQWAKLKDYAP